MPRRRTDPTIADMGCGTGASTSSLAHDLDAHIAAVDVLPAFLDRLDDQGVADRITTLAASMDESASTTNPSTRSGPKEPSTTSALNTGSAPGDTSPNPAASSPCPNSLAHPPAPPEPTSMSKRRAVLTADQRNGAFQRGAGCSGRGQPHANLGPGEEGSTGRTCPCRRRDGAGRLGR